MKFKLVKNSSEFYEFIRELRVHPKNIKGFLEQVEITPEQQKKYMEKYSSNYYICLENETPVGWVGEVDSDIRVCTHPDHKNKGIAKFMINELVQIKPESEAKVLLDNVASINLFKSCDFKEIRKDENFIFFKRN